ncbi:MAG: FAD-binding oxidoreductase [Actinomycetes bacterium]
MTTPTNVSELQGSGTIQQRFAGRAVTISPEVLGDLAASGAEVITDELERAATSRDWWPLSIGWAAQGRVGALAAAVVRPHSTEEVSAVLAICHKAGIPVTPVAGRSGVCGGSIPIHGGVSLDLTELDRVLEVDETSLTLRVQAGVFGPDLETHLGRTGTGYTLGHWPQSMDLSTVGGWLACRGAGQYSTRYGKIEDMVRGLTVVLADGTVVVTEGTGPRAATGPNLTQLFVGSEGTLGVITEATFSIRPLPGSEQRGAWGFSTFDEGLDACRRILRRGATPAVLRLYDEIESKRNFGEDCNVLIVLDEADAALVEATMRIVSEEVGQATVLDIAHVATWLGHRNDVSALRPLWEAKVVVDTIEMSGPWGSLQPVYDEVLAALRGIEGTMVASVHQSHAYSDGACLYFTFAGRVSEKPDDSYGDLGAEEAYYRQCWDAATTVIERHGAAISHHHGIGMNRGRFLAGALGAAHDTLRAIKATLDPAGILNPGKLGLGDEVDW